MFVGSKSFAHRVDSAPGAPTRLGGEEHQGISTVAPVVDREIKA